MKKRTLISLTLFPAVVAIILVLALLTLDLNPYRGQVVWSLEQAFSRPVQLGTIELTYHNGLALELHDLVVGASGDDNHFRTGKGLFRLQLGPLTRGVIAFNEIQLEKPRLQITLPSNDNAQEQSEPPSGSLLANLGGLKQLRLRDADVLLRSASPDTAPFTLQHLNLDLEGLQPGKTCQIHLRGELGEGTLTTPITLSARMQIPQASESWVDRQIDIKLAASRVKRSNWQALLPQTLSSLLPELPFDFHLALNNHQNGKLSAAVTFENSNKNGACLPPNLTLNLSDATLGGSYGRQSANYELALEGHGKLESCGAKLATFSLRQELARDAEQTRFSSNLDARFAAATTLTWLTPENSKLKATGNLPLKLAVAGTAKQADWQLQGDLQEIALYHGALMLKTPGIAGTLKAHGQLGKGLPFTAADLKLGTLQATLTNTGGAGKEPTLELNVPPAELDTLGEIIPALAQWELRGNLSGSYRLRKTGDGWQRDGVLELTELAANHPYPLGPVRNTTARIVLANDRLDFTCAPLGLGSSQLQVRGEIADLRTPHFMIHAHTASMLARDLVFKRPGVHLNDLAGTLKIDGKGIDFIDARVRLDNGTRADVDGHLDFHANRLYLNARASYGHIDEVIQLFSGPARWNDETLHQRAALRHGPHFKVIVEADSTRGEIGGVSFENAHGTVTVSEGNVEVYPLTFKGQGQGTANARVYYQGRSNQPGWLRVSGHLKQFNSAALFEQYWKRESPIKGPLDCDFFLQGPSSGQFFTRGDGAVYLEISDGTLRKFNAISKAFSLLNVSQLFKGELPDVSGHGMKFKLGKGTLSFGGSYVYFDDLAIFSNSLNMSMVGRVGLEKTETDYILGVQPLQTVDKVVSNIPVVGWVLTGDEKTLFTVHFQVTGPLADPEVVAIPGSSLSSGILGIFQRTLQLPGKLVK